jgi:hypothetical protein
LLPMCSKYQGGNTILATCILQNRARLHVNAFTLLATLTTHHQYVVLRAIGNHAYSIHRDPTRATLSQTQHRFNNFQEEDHVILCSKALVILQKDAKQGLCFLPFPKRCRCRHHVLETRVHWILKVCGLRLFPKDKLEFFNVLALFPDSNTSYEMCKPKFSFEQQCVRCFKIEDIDMTFLAQGSKSARFPLLCVRVGKQRLRWKRNGVEKLDVLC